MDQKERAMLQEKAREIRRQIIKMVGGAGSGHPGGSLSLAEILAYLFFKEMRLDANNPSWQERDRLVLSKGHAAPALYAALAERGFFPKGDLASLRRINSQLQGHPDMQRTPGVEMSTGSLGTGFSTSIGMALAAKLDQKDVRVYAILGDGEVQEGQIWEAAMAASHYQLDNLIAILDNNGLQIDGKITDVLSPEPLDAKWRAFGWEVLKIDGHNLMEIEKALTKAKEIKNKPVMIIAKTIKGKGVSFMEDQAGWHGTAPKPDQVEKALNELQSAN